MEPVRLGQPLFLALACPAIGLATADVYRGVTVPEIPETGEAIRRAAVEGDIEELGRRLHNRLQPAAERLCPEVVAVQRRLVELNPAGALMSGSGSSLFALCRESDDAVRLARDLRAVDTGRNLKVFIVRSCS